MVSSSQNSQSESRAQLLELINRLHREWEQTDSSSAPVDVSALVASSPTQLTIPDLCELLRLDLDLQLRSGRKTKVESYFLSFPQLEHTPEQMDLICEEYRLRQKYGDKPSLGSYGARFPHLLDSLVAKLYSSSISQQDSPTNQLEGLDQSPTLHEKPISMVASSMADHYRFIRPLGSGTYGEVWLAEAPGGVEVAIKRLFRSIQDAEGKRELQVLELIKRLRHPFLLLTHAYFEQEGRLCIVMELADSSLRDRLKACRKEGLSGIPRDEILSYMKESAEALDYLHSKKIQHRDIKPENILLVEGHVKVADFGLARESKGHQEQEYSIASFCGSPHYIAPEVWAQQITPRSDQYSLAISYVELKTGQRPFAGSSFQDIMFAHLESDPALGGLAAQEQEVLRKALSKDPADRYETCREMVLALMQATGAQSSSPSLSASMSSAQPRKERRSLLIPMLAVMLMIALGVGTAFMMGMFSSEEKKPQPQVIEKPPTFEPGPEQGIDGKLTEFPRTIRTVYHDHAIVMNLIPGDVEHGIRPFYMMTTEVPYGLFEQVARSPEYQMCLRKYYYEGEKTGAWRALNDDRQHPVRSVTVLEAHCFAEALTKILKLGEWNLRLPSGDQWLKAAGYFESEEVSGIGPFKKDWEVPKKPSPTNREIALNQGALPMEVGQASKDVSIFGIRDLSANVQEWTRTVKNRPGQSVPLANPSKLDTILIYGREFTGRTPFLFEPVRTGKWAESKPYFESSRALGIRIVLEPPSKD